MANVIVVMGVSGSGKTTIGKLLADACKIPFLDGDDFHPEENKIKMKSGIPLNDDDRKPWLVRLHKIALEYIDGKGCVIACSALKEMYRQMLMEGISDQVQWVFLDGQYDLIRERMQDRNDHYMKYSMLKSQFDILERPEYGIRVSIDNEPEIIVNQILTQLEH